MRVSIYFILLFAAILMIFGCSSSSSGDDGGSNGDASLVNLWNITSYSDEDGVGDYSGWLEFDEDGTFDSELQDSDYPSAFNISGTWSTSRGSLTLVVQESNDPWMPEGTYIWNYTISGNTLSMSITVDGDNIQMTFDKDTSTVVGHLNGTVTDANGNAVAGVMVNVLTSGKTASTGTDGNYTVSNIPVGVYSVQFIKTGYISYTEEAVQIVQNVTTDLDVQIEEGEDDTGILTGIVSDGDTSDAIEGATVAIDGTSLTTTTDSDGLYLIANVPAGDYDVTASKSGYTPETVTVGISGGITTNQDITLYPGSGDGTGTLEGYVTDVSNQYILAGATIMLEGTSFSATSDAFGYYIISGIPAGDYTAVCSKTGYNEDDAYVTIIANQVTEYTFLMIEEGNEPYAILSGSVTAAGYNTPINNVIITVGEAGAGASDETGSYEAMVLTAGTYDVTFTKVGFEPYTVTGVTFTIGQTVNLDAELTMYTEETTNNLQVYVSKDDLTPIQGATVTLQGTSYTGTTNIVGLCTFNDIPVGVYQMDVSKTGYQSVTGRYTYVYSYQGTPAVVSVILETN